MHASQPASLSAVRGAAIALVMMVATLAVAPPASAQDNQITALAQQIQRMRDELTLLQRNYYQGRQGAPPPELPAAAGPGLQQMTAFEIRVNELEDELRGVVGAVEQVQRRISESQARLDKLVGDVDFRLNAIERQIGSPATPAGAPAVAAPAAPIQRQAAVQPAAPTPVPAQPAARPGVLGTLTPEQARAPATVAPAPPQAAATILPPGSAKVRYDFAYGLLQQFRIPEAERAFTEFLGLHAADDLAHNARYWLGETYYARAQYQQAAVTFFDGYQKGPTGPKAADNLLKLGMSLGRMNQKQEACATLAELSQRFANAAASIRDQAAAERRRLAC